jgi:hypothetical protein
LKKLSNPIVICSFDGNNTTISLVTLLSFVKFVKFVRLFVFRCSLFAVQAPPYTPTLVALTTLP